MRGDFPGWLIRGRRQQPRWLLAAVAIASLLTTTAHDLYTAYVQQRIDLKVGAEHTDLTLDLTLFEEWSARERSRMDRDGDGRITRAEADDYLKKAGPEWGKQVRLLAGGREVPLVELYAPELDLLGTDRAGPAHHRLRLYYFAPTPADLRAGDAIVIETGLFPEAQGLVAIDAEGRDGCKLKAKQPASPRLEPVQTNESRQFEIRCLAPPAAAMKAVGPNRVSDGARKKL